MFVAHFSEQQFNHPISVRVFENEASADGAESFGSDIRRQEQLVDQILTLAGEIQTQGSVKIVKKIFTNVYYD